MHYVFFIAELYLFITTKVLENEKELYKRKIAIKRKTAMIYAFCSFILVVLAYPTLPNLGAELSRDSGILPSSLVVPFACLMLAITYDYLKSGFYFKMLTALTLFWIMFHGDRVIVLGFLIYLLLKYMNDGKFDFETLKSIIFNKRTVIVFIIVIVVAVISIKVQITRGGSTYSLTYAELIHNIVKQGTAGDVVFAFNCSTDMWKNGQGMNGHTYLYYLSNLLPSADQSLYSAMILANRYNTLGGGLFFVEPMMNGGLFLTSVHTLVFLNIIALIFKHKTDYTSFLIIPFIILIFRFTWYASLAGAVKMVLYYVPLLFIGTKIIRLH